MGCADCNDAKKTLGGLLEACESELATLRQAYSDLRKDHLLLAAAYDKATGDGISKAYSPISEVSSDAVGAEAPNVGAVQHRPVRTGVSGPLQSQRRMLHGQGGPRAPRANDATGSVFRPMRRQTRSG